MEERKAISLLQKGDLRGLEPLVERYQVQAVQAACLIVLDRALAEDVVQKAFITAAERIHQYDPERPFKAWFFRSVVNASIKAARNQNKLISLDDPIPGQAFSLADIMADERSLPEEWIQDQENRASIQAAIDKLPADQRAVIVMRYFLEISEIEMAEKMEKPISTIKYWLRTARKNLNHLLNPERNTPSPRNEQPIVVPEKNEKEA